MMGRAPVAPQDCLHLSSKHAACTHLLTCLLPLACSLKVKLMAEVASTPALVKQVMRQWHTRAGQTHWTRLAPSAFPMSGPCASLLPNN